MKTFYFTDLRSHGALRESTTPILRPTWAVVRSASLGDARRALRGSGLSAKFFRIATSSEAALVESHAPGTVVWSRDIEDDPIVGVSVDEWVAEHPSGAYVRYTYRDGTSANGTPF